MTTLRDNPQYQSIERLARVLAAMQNPEAEQLFYGAGLQSALQYIQSGVVDAFTADLIRAVEPLANMSRVFDVRAANAGLRTLHTEGGNR